MNRRFSRIFNAGARLGLALGCAMALAAPALADEPGASAWFATEQGRVRLIAAEPAAGTGGTLRLGLQFELAPHWKIYWRSPGDAGYPPQLDWAASQNLKSTAVSWPAPMRFTLFGLDTMGYENAVVLPIAAAVAEPGQPVHLRADLQYLTCERICIPYETTLALDLPGGAAPAGTNGFADLIARYQAAVPGDGTASGLRLAALTLEAGADPALILALEVDPPLKNPDAFIEGAPGYGFGAPAFLGEDPQHPSLRVPVFADAKDIGALARSKLTLTVVDGPRAMEVQAVPAEAAPRGTLAQLAPMILVALLGGFILNFMPCVLPVLSLKLLAAVNRGGQDVGRVRRGFLASAAGILISFLVLAGAMAVLRRAGIAVGWGVQFQQPYFLVAMAVLTTLFAANLWGWFEIPLPRALADRVPAQSGGTLLGNFASGAFATLLATPCSAPFLGTAVGFALMGSSAELFVIFAALGVGLSLPYLAVAVLPRLARLLPRPGHWMIVLRRVLGLALFCTAAWLVFVLRAEAGPGAALAAATALLMLLLALGAIRTPLPRTVGALAAIAAAFIAAGNAQPPAPAVASADALWQPFERGRIANLVAEGKTVFVDVTADWCLTCQVNKRLVLDQEPVRARLAAPGTVALVADWTRPDPAIAAYLRSYGRYGIPFNAVYGPAAPAGIPLSELLTASEVLRALERARGAATHAGQASPETPRSGG